MPEDIKPEWEKSAAEIFQPFIDAQPSLGLLPPGGLRTEPGGTKRAEIVFTPERSKAFREAARMQGLSVSSAVQAAAIMGLSFMNDPDAQPENFASWTPTDLRKYCPQPFDGPVHAPSLRVGGFPLVVKSRGLWSEISQATSKLNKPSWDMKENDLMFIREPYFRISIAMFEAMMDQPEISPSTDPMLSGLGILDDYIKHKYGSVVVEDVSTMVHIATPSICLHYWSWSDELHLSANSNVAHYSAGYIQKYLDATKDIMVENLLGKDAV